MRKILLPTFFLALAVFFVASPALAHFGIVLPSKSMVMDKKDTHLKLDISFSHPFARQGMDMKKPASFFVVANGKKTDLLSSLKQTSFFDSQAWQGEYDIKRPGTYQFAVEPVPYYEPAEDSFILHYTKTVVGAFGNEDGWEEPLGLPVEIVPLTRPFGNYAGNVFSGLVLQNGKPAINVPVEVENLNISGLHAEPNAYFETQVTRTDANGVFTFGIPWAGWWGFAALCESEGKIEINNQPKDVELGGVIWLEFLDPVITKSGNTEKKQ